MDLIGSGYHHVVTVWSDDLTTPPKTNYDRNITRRGNCFVDRDRADCQSSDINNSKLDGRELVGKVLAGFHEGALTAPNFSSQRLVFILMFRVVLVGNLLYIGWYLIATLNFWRFLFFSLRKRKSHEGFVKIITNWSCDFNFRFRVWQDLKQVQILFFNTKFFCWLVCGRGQSCTVTSHHFMQILHKS